MMAFLIIALLFQFALVIVAVILAAHFHSANILLKKFIIEQKRDKKRLQKELILWQDVTVKRVIGSPLRGQPNRERANEDERKAPPKVISQSQAIAMQKAENAKPLVKIRQQPSITAKKVPPKVAAEFLNAK